MKRLLICFLVLLASAVHTTAQTFHADSLRQGDLLFAYDLRNNAITDVTEGKDNLPIDHVGIAVRQDSAWQVLEAVHKGVRLTPLAEFCHNFSAKDGTPLVVIGRVTGDIDIEASIGRAMKHIGKPYDFYFMPDDKEMYCSELVQKSYVDHEGRLIFKSIPMSFHNRKGKITRYWKRYYRRAGLSVPEGKDGSNPGDLSRSPRVRIIR